MKYLLLCILTSSISCARVYTKAKSVDFNNFKQKLNSVYSDKNISFLSIEGDFESYGKTYMKGFFKAYLKNDSFKIKIISPPFSIREIKNIYFKEILKSYFNPGNFLKNMDIIGIEENENFFILRLKNAEIFFEKGSLRILKIYLEDGSIKFANFHNGLPLLVKINTLDEKIELKINQMNLYYE